MIKLTDDFLERSSELSDAAFRLYVEGRLLASRKLTDGVLTQRNLEWLGARGKDRQELTDSGLWEELEDGAVIDFDYLDHHPSRAQVEADRRASSERMRRRRGGHDGPHVTPEHQGEQHTERIGEHQPEQLPEHHAERTVGTDPPVSPHTPLPLTPTDPSLFPDSDLPVSSSENLSGGSARDAKRLPKQAAKQVKRKPRSAFPEDWKPKPEHIERAARMGLDVSYQAGRFKFHHMAKGSLMASWDAAFTTWLMGAPEYAPRINGKPPGAVEHDNRQRERAIDPPREFRPAGELKPIDPQAALAALATVRGRP